MFSNMCSPKSCSFYLHHFPLAPPMAFLPPDIWRDAAARRKRCISSRLGCWDLGKTRPVCSVVLVYLTQLVTIIKYKIYYIYVYIYSYMIWCCMIVNMAYNHIYWYLGGTIGDMISILCPWHPMAHSRRSMYDTYAAYAYLTGSFSV